jgi:hypothetical protein
MLHPGDDQIDEIWKRDQCSAVLQRREGERYPLPDKSDEQGEIAPRTGSIDERRANDDDLHACSGGDFMQPDFSFQLRDAIGIDRHWRIVVPEGPIVLLTIDLDAADEDEPFYARAGGLLGEVQGGGGVDPTKFRKRIGCAVVHDVNTSGEMDDDINTLESRCPIGFACYLNGEMPHRCREAGGCRSRRHHKLAYPLSVQSFDERPTDKAGCAGNEASHDLFPVLP